METRFWCSLKTGSLPLTFFLFFIFSCFSLAQNKDSLWQPFKYFEGNWVGKGGGEPGEGDYERSYKMIFNGKYMQVNNKSVYPKQEKNPKGETHEDIGYISYDRYRKNFIVREFHIEGFVNQYTLQDKNDSSLVFVSENIENIPQGFRARHTLKIISKDEFKETFEIAEPGKDFEVYTEVLLKRKNS